MPPYRTRMAPQNTRTQDSGMTIARISIGVFLGGVAVLVVYKLMFAAPQSDPGALLAVAEKALQDLQESKHKVAGNEVREIQRLCEQYMLQKQEQCPSSMEDLKAAGVTARVKRDPWGSEYIIKCPGTHGRVDVISAGPDRKLASNDDINSWSVQKP